MEFEADQRGLALGALPSEVRKRISDLERRLAQALLERDDLARDVEALCMETTANSTFSSSSVLRERIFSTGKMNNPRHLVLNFCWIYLTASIFITVS